MMRKCHQNTCPVGVATQNEELRKRFHGRSEYLINFFTFLAQEVREYLAEMGFTKMDDIIGRTDLIERKSDENDPNPKHALIDFTKLLARVDNSAAIRHVIDQDHGISTVKDVAIIDAAQEAINTKRSFIGIHNCQYGPCDRCHALRCHCQKTRRKGTAGTYLECEIQRLCGTVIRCLPRTGSQFQIGR